MSTQQKQVIRDRILKARQGLTAVERSARSETVVHAVLEHPRYQSATHIGGYLPMLGEVDVLPVLSHAREAGKRVYLPRLLEGGKLEFAEYHPAQIVRGPRGVMQPAPELDTVALAEIHLILVPALAYDVRKYRLGLGAGYYDKTFEGLNPRPHLLGVGFDFQLVDELPTDPWDVALDGLVLETRVL